MNISEAKNIPVADYMQSIGITPCKRQRNNLWYFSPFRNETEPSFKVNLARNEWYDFGLGKDLNDYLCGKKQVQQKVKKRGLRL